MSQFAIGADEWPGLSKLLEEAGEVVQVGGKLMGSFGDAEGHWSGDLRVMLVDELADLAAAIQFFAEYNMTHTERAKIRRRTAAKYKTFVNWHQEYRDGA